METITHPQATPAGLTIDEWCASVRICRASFYNIPKSHRPESVKLGSRVVVIEEPLVWLRRMSKAGVRTTAQGKNTR